MAASWLESLKSAQKTALVQDGKKKIHFKFTDGREMVEEYDMRTNELIVRKWNKVGKLGGPGKWDFEVGEEAQQPALATSGFTESSSNPIVVRKDTKRAYQWRIRNLPYPLETYDVKVNEEEQVIIIKTTNKKYYKKLSIPDMKRCQLSLENSQLSIAHANNTLIVTYEKPADILSFEKQVMDELSKTKASKDGDVDCAQS